MGVWLMEKIERTLLEPEVNFNDTKIGFSKRINKIQTKIETFFIKKGFILLLIGFLLGRALILAKLTPFSLPFFAAVYLIKRDRAPIALLGLIAGAATLSLPDAIFAFGSAVIFLIVYRGTKKWIKDEMKAIPIFHLRWRYFTL